MKYCNRTRFSKGVPIKMVLLLERFAVIHKESFPNKKAAALMMWSGLQNTDAFKKLSAEYKRVIVATILEEKRLDNEGD